MSLPVGLGPDGVVRCRHGDPAKRSTSGTPRNPGRDFFACPRQPKGAQCKYFCWADLIFPEDEPPQPSSDHPQNANSVYTPQPDLLHSTPTKRKLREQPATTPRNSDTDTPSKKARLEAIEAGLRARDQEQAHALPFTNDLSDTQTSQTDTEPAKSEEPPRRYSFLGLPLTQESESGEGPSTPKKRARSPAGDIPLLYGLRAKPSSSALLTPPDSWKPCPNRVQVSGSSSSRPVPVTPTQPKGKERAKPAWDCFTAADEENPFDETSPSLKSRSEQEHQRGSIDSSSSHTLTTGEHIASAVSGMRGAINSLRTFADELDQLDAVKYIERLERQNRSLEFKDEAKRVRITELEAECKELKEKVEQLARQCHAKDKMIDSLT